ncbi:unnamed protein product, partial [Polarella glacialis]
MESAPGSSVIAVEGGISPGCAVQAAGSVTTSGTVQARHGAVAGAAALTDVLQDRISETNQAAIRNLVPALEKARAYRGRGGEVVRQAACRLLACVAAAKTWQFKDATAVRYLQTVDECARHTTEMILFAAADALRVLARFRLKPEMCLKCVDNYIASLKKGDEMISARRGSALCLGAIPVAVLGERRREVLEVLCKEAKGLECPGGKDQDDPTTRVYAVLSLGRLVLATSITPEETALVVSTLEATMRDYATDRRGDVGSWVREISMEVVAALLDVQKRGPSASEPSLPDAATSTRLLALLMQQAVEKIDRLRERSFGLLRRLMCGAVGDGPSNILELAYRRVCHSESYDSMGIANSFCQAAPAIHVERAAWPPAQAATLTAALRRKDDALNDEAKKDPASSSTAE